jgi:hypothetical protein
MIPTDRLCQIVEVQNPQVAMLLAEIRSRDALIRRTKILGIVHRRCNAIRGIIDQEAFRRIMDGEAVTREDCWPHLFPRNTAGAANVSNG